MVNNNWFIESLTLTQAIAPPRKEEMEKVLPLSWPPRWEEYRPRQVGESGVTVWLAHINPDPEMAAVNPEDPNFSADPSKLKTAKYDYTSLLSIMGFADKQTARQFFESHRTFSTMGLSAPVPGTTMDISLGDLLKAFVPEKMVKELEALDKGREKVLAESGAKFEKGTYLDEEAIMLSKDGKNLVQAVLINNFVISGTLLLSDLLPSCKTLALKHVNKEEVEEINRSLFLRVKGEKEEETEEVNAEIIRASRRIENPKEKFEFKNGDTIETNKRTQVNIADSAGNKMWIGGGSKVKINEPSNFELLLGTVTAFLSKLQPKTKFEVHTPTAILGVCGTIFSIYFDKDITSLTVIEGEVGFSDLEGRKVIVKSKQTCICSKDKGLQKPVTLPINLKEQFKGV